MTHGSRSSFVEYIGNRARPATRLKVLAERSAEPHDWWRPLTRRDCQDSPRPCPFVSCKWNLYLDVLPRSGNLQLNFPELEPHEMGESCTLDVADRGGGTLEVVGEAMNLTRERARQMEQSLLTELAPVFAELEGLPTRAPAEEARQRAAIKSSTFRCRGPCGLEKPRKFFYPNRDNAIGHRYYCMDCDRKNAIDRWAKRKQTDGEP